MSIDFNYTTNEGSVVDEVEAIIARAMAEYANAHPDFSESANTVVSEFASVDAITAEVPQIPENSNSVLISENTSRFSSAIWYENVQSKQIVLAGLGGIGSYVAYLLGRLHPSTLYLFDGDIVEDANRSGQLYDKASIGRYKVDATVNELAAFSDFYNVVAYPREFTTNDIGGNIMICGFDNMAARKLYFSRWLKNVACSSQEDKKKCLFIDGRLAAETLQVLCIRGDDDYNIEQYKDKWLFYDHEAEEAVCSYKQTSFMANMIGSIIVNLFVNFCANECDPLIPRDLPFLTEYSAETMHFKVIA